MTFDRNPDFALFSYPRAYKNHLFDSVIQQLSWELEDSIQDKLMLGNPKITHFRAGTSDLEGGLNIFSSIKWDLNERLSHEEC